MRNRSKSTIKYPWFRIFTSLASLTNEKIAKQSIVLPKKYRYSLKWLSKGCPTQRKERQLQCFAKRVIHPCTKLLSKSGQVKELNDYQQLLT